MDKNKILNLNKFLNEAKVNMHSRKQYPELAKIVDKLADEVSKKINSEVKKIKSEMPYKAQWVLEELIFELEDRV